MTARFPVLIGFVVAVLLVTGCAPESGGAASVSAPSPTASVSEEVAAQPISGQPGDPLTAAEAKQLNGQIGTLRPYEMNDGSFVIIDVKQPLPQAVKQEVAESLRGTSNSDLGNYFDEILRQEGLTGKTVISVRKIHAGDGNGSDVFAWMPSTSAHGFPLGIMASSAESVVSEVRPWVDAQNDPAQLEIIVVND
ncbi:hypothetical protein Q9R19_09230 [Microbacterium sp. ARD32]|uniref:hypothetical protein n=1 Tax=Microbacterium sp. ARD32 TaxID=2962577 RepID=UPI002882077E|nr:hypothetical protein [Microbacterium sp. ARD32]MDT0157805.1 hypothetical protein [Microbacterium sp. ARD32]